MKLADFDYHLTEKLIAQKPLKERTASRLMVLNKKDHVIHDDLFENLIAYLDPGDLLVMNNSRVLPARLFGEIRNYAKKVEVFLLKEVSKAEKELKQKQHFHREAKACRSTDSFSCLQEGVAWECLVKPGKKLKEGVEIKFSPEFSGKVLKINKDGTRLIQFNQSNIYPFLDEQGEMPLPPYIKEKLEEKERYQTVYSDKLGSVAAPTAGLHFTEKYLNKLKQKGVELGFVRLDVGLGTFLPVKADQIEEHEMHSEKYEISQVLVDKIKTVKKAGKKVLAVGTTSMRVLESSLDQNGNLIAQKGETDIFIYPPYDFKIVDALLTNFHLPKSTLLMLVSALAGKEFVFEAYRKAVDLEYRFFSFGDAMLIK